MDNKNIIIIILVCVLVAISALVAYSMLFSQTQPDQNITLSNRTADVVTADTISHEDQASSSSSSGSGGTHTEHLNGGDVEVDENGIVVGTYNSKGQYFPGGQLGGMTIEEARAFDERASKYGLT